MSLSPIVAVRLPNEVMQALKASAADKYSNPARVVRDWIVAGLKQEGRLCDRNGEKP